MGVLLIDARGVDFDPEFSKLWNSLKAFFVGLYAVTLILALGGPTGMLLTPHNQSQLVPDKLGVLWSPSIAL